MTSRIAVILTLGMALALGACAEKSTEWDNYDSTRHNTVELLRIPYDIQFAGDMTVMTARESARLDGFLQTVKPGAQDVIALDVSPDPSGIGVARAEAARAYLVKAGYRVAAGTAPAGAAPAADSVRLVVERAVVRTPQCPDWSRKAAPNYSNAPTSNIGCASETALGLMIANPRDLVAPADYEPANAEAAAKAVQNLRDDKVKWSKDQRSGSTMSVTK